jgi:hypothetical protein
VCSHIWKAAAVCLQVESILQTLCEETEIAELELKVRHTLLKAMAQALQLSAPQKHTKHSLLGHFRIADRNA